MPVNKDHISKSKSPKKYNKETDIPEEKFEMTRFANEERLKDQRHMSLFRKDEDGFCHTDDHGQKKKDWHVMREPQPLYLHFYNSAPKYITFPKLFTQLSVDSTLSTDLITHLESNSSDSCLGVTDDIVVECNLHETAKGTKMLEQVEKQLNAVKVIVNTFLQQDSPIFKVDSWNDIVWIRKYTNNENRINTIANIHSDYNAEYELAENNTNYATPDLASLLVALNGPDEYVGGETVISDGFHPQTGEAQFKKLKKLDTGAGFLWDGWTLHGVNPVTSGVRYIMTVHFFGQLK